MAVEDNVRELRALAADEPEESALRVVASTAADALEAFDVRMKRLEDEVLPRKPDEDVGLA